MSDEDAKTPRVKIRRLWIGGDDPGVQIFEVDPPLSPGEVEVDLGDVHDSSPGESIAPRARGRPI